MSTKSLAIVVLLLFAVLLPAAPALADRHDGWRHHGHHHHGHWGRHHWRGCDRVVVRERYRPCPPPRGVVVKEVWVDRRGW